MDKADIGVFTLQALYIFCHNSGLPSCLFAVGRFCFQRTVEKGCTKYPVMGWRHVGDELYLVVSVVSLRKAADGKAEEKNIRVG